MTTAERVETKRAELTALGERRERALAQLDAEREDVCRAVGAGKSPSPARLQTLQLEADSLQALLAECQETVGQLEEQLAAETKSIAAAAADVAFEAATKEAEGFRQMLRSFIREQLLPAADALREQIAAAAALDIAGGAPAAWGSTLSARTDRILFRTGTEELVRRLRHYLENDPVEEALRREEHQRRMQLENEQRAAERAAAAGEPRADAEPVKYISDFGVARC